MDFNNLEDNLESELPGETLTISVASSGVLKFGMGLPSDNVAPAIHAGVSLDPFNCATVPGIDILGRAITLPMDVKAEAVLHSLGSNRQLSIGATILVDPEILASARPLFTRDRFFFLSKRPNSLIASVDLRIGVSPSR